MAADDFGQKEGVMKKNVCGIWFCSKFISYLHCRTVVYEFSQRDIYQ